MAKHPITKTWMLEALSDREWHSQYELINRATNSGLKPEMMSRRYYETVSRRKTPIETDVDDAIHRSTKRLVQKWLSHLYGLGLIEYRGDRGSEERESRFVGWYCWNCGKLCSTKPVEDNRCGKCPIHCCNCGIIIAKPKYEDDEVCDKCHKLRQDLSERMAAIAAIDEPTEVKPSLPKRVHTPVTLRFPKIVEQEPVPTPSPAPKLEQPQDEDDIGGTLVYHSSIKPRKSRRKKPKESIAREPKQPKPKEPKAKKPRRRRKRVKLEDFELRPDRFLLLTYNPIADIGVLPELMGVAIKHTS
jgi:hypothetical protein